MRLLGNRFGSRLGVVTLLATGTAVLLVAPPALAEPAGADLQMSIASTKVVEQTSKPFLVHLYNDGPAAADNIVANIDLSGLDTTKLNVQPPVGCDLNGTTYSCRLGSLDPGEFNDLFSPVTLDPLPDAEKGPAGSFTIEVTSDTPDPDAKNNEKVTVPVEIAPLAYDLYAVVNDIWAFPSDNPREGVKPGDTVPFVFDVLNIGTETAEDIVWTVSLPPFVTFAKDEHRPYCRYNRTRTEATCELRHAKLHPNGGASLSAKLKHPMLVTVATDAPGPGALVGGTVAVGARRTSAPVSEPAAAASVAEEAADVKVYTASAEQRRRAVNNNDDNGEHNNNGDADRGDNGGAFSVHTANNPADLAVFGGSASGALGSEVTIGVKVRNNGPATSPSTTLVVRAPTGTELVDLPSGCEFTTPGKVGKCEGVLAALEEDTGNFVFKIASTTISNDGLATISGTLEDPNAANNSAAIVITVGAGGGGGLPITGTKVTVVGGVGAAVVVAGLALFLFARRRRIQLVLPSED